MPVKAKKGLGRGLGALFTENAEENVQDMDILSDIEHAGEPKADGKAVVTLKIIDIEPNKEQPRKSFDADKLTALSESIATHGVVQPILVLLAVFVFQYLPQLILPVGHLIHPL